jgi:hypothetical protein
MLDNYFNPQGMAPNMGWDKTGIMQAFYQPEQMRRYRDLMALQQALTQDSLRRQSAETDTYMKEEGVRSSKRGADTSKFGLDKQNYDVAARTSGYSESLARGEIGRQEQDAQKGEFAKATNPGNIKLAQAQQQLQMLDHAADQLQRAGTIDGQAMWKQIYSQLPPEAQRMLPEMYGPTTAARLKQFVAASNTKLSEHGRKLEEIKATGDYHIKVGQGNNTTSIEVAKIRAQEQKRDMMNSFTRAIAAGRPYGVMSAGQILLDSSDLTPTERKAIERAVEQAQTAYTNELAGRQQGIGDVRNPGSTQQRILGQFQRPGGQGLNVSPTATFGGMDPNDPLGLRRR